MANSYTNLKNNYMYGSKNRLNNYYQNYKNFTNDLDDPIFTGFTLYINMSQSPLFGDYSKYTTDNDDTISASSLASTLENSIKSKHDSRNNNYDPTITTIEKFNSNSKIGYGNQEKVYSEGFSYNALEYIFMVDKIMGKTSVANNNTSTNENLTSNSSLTIGPSEKATKAYTKASEKANDLVEKIENTDEDNEKKQAKLDKLKEEYIEKNDAYISSLKDKFYDANDEYKSAKEEYESAISELNECKNKLKEEEEFNSKLEDVLSSISSAKSALKYLLGYKLVHKDEEETLDGVITDEVESTSTDKFKYIAESIYTSYGNESWFGYKYGIQHNTISLFSYESIYAELSLTYSGIIFEKLTDDTVKYILELAYIDEDAINSKINSSTTKDEYNSILKKLYGVDENVNLLSESNPSSDSLCGKFQEAKANVEAIRNSDEMNNLATISSDISSALSSFDNNQNLSTTVNTDDSSTTVEQSEPISESEFKVDNSKKTVSTLAPQTCLDLVSFINGMKKITESYPYIFQSVTGLDDAYKNYFKVSEPYQGSGENKITINCYESVDMKISSLFNKYFNAAYDREYKRERLPVNLRRFNCSIFVHDIRNFRHALNLLYKKEGRFKEDNDIAVNQGLITEIALNHLSVVEFKFFDCEILQEDTGGIFDTVNNADLGEQRMTNFSFKYGNCYINFLPFNDLVTYYRTSGSNNDLGDDTNITTATRTVELVNNKITKTASKETSQVSDFKEYESKITGNNETSTSKFKQRDLDTGFETSDNDKISSLGNINYDDEIEYQNMTKDGSSYNVVDGHLVFTPLNTGGTDHEGGTNIGNVNYNDYDEMLNVDYNTDYNTSKSDYFNRKNAEEISEMNSEELIRENNMALDVTIRGLSASTGYTTEDIYEKLGIENVYKTDEFNKVDNNEDLGNVYKEEYFKSTKNTATSEDVSAQGDIKYISTGNEISMSDESISKDEILLNDNKYNSVRSNLSNISQESINKYNEELNGIDDTLFGNPNGINDHKHTGIDTSETDYVKSSGNQIGKIYEKTSSNNVSYIGSINTSSNTSSNIINKEFDEIDNNLFGNNLISGINDHKHTGFDTSETDYVKSSLNDQIGIIQENKIEDTSFIDNGEGEVYNDNINVSKIYSDQSNSYSTKRVNSIGNIYNESNLENDKKITELGNVITDSLNNEDIVTEIDTINVNSNSTEDVKSIGKLNYNNQSDDIYSSNETIYKEDDNDIKNTSNIGKVNEYTESKKSYSTLGSIDNNINKSKDITSIYREVEKIKTGDTYSSSKIDDNIIVNDNIIKGIGNVYNNIKDSNHIYNSEKISNDLSYEDVNEIGNVNEDLSINDIEITDLNDVSFK